MPWPNTRGYCIRRTPAIRPRTPPTREAPSRPRGPLRCNHGVHAMQRIGFIVFPDFEVLSLDTATVFEVANLIAPEQLYELHVLSDTGGAVSTSIGMSVDTKAFGKTDFDTLIVSGTLFVKKPFSPFSPNLIAYL